MAGPLPTHLLPEHSEISPEGRLSIGGCDLLDVAAEFGTPLFVYDEEQLRSRCREAVAAFGPGGASYATKAFLCVAMARLAHEEGMKLDVSTAGEYHIARAAGVPADALILHGNNKSPAELAQALDAGVGVVVLDSFYEIARLDRLARDEERRLKTEGKIRSALAYPAFVLVVAALVLVGASGLVDLVVQGWDAVRAAAAAAAPGGSADLFALTG